jgi:hypothetical protein
MSAPTREDLEACCAHLSAAQAVSGGDSPAQVLAAAAELRRLVALSPDATLGPALPACSACLAAVLAMGPPALTAAVLSAVLAELLIRTRSDREWYTCVMRCSQALGKGLATVQSCVRGGFWLGFLFVFCCLFCWFFGFLFFDLFTDAGFSPYCIDSILLGCVFYFIYCYMFARQPILRPRAPRGRKRCCR